MILTVHLFCDYILEVLELLKTFLKYFLLIKMKRFLDFLNVFLHSLKEFFTRFTRFLLVMKNHVTFCFLTDLNGERL